ncbi:hypothetical protein PM082_006964 [Marasmius tenuissimus]|nr:hypothetical protein PM082_006964 [Marasmius tenuissimus]
MPLDAMLVELEYDPPGRPKCRRSFGRMPKSGSCPINTGAGTRVVGHALLHFGCPVANDPDAVTITEAQRFATPRSREE